MRQGRDRKLKVGSLFSGYGGLDMGVRMVLDAAPVWHADIEPGPTKILAHHWPDVPNLGDITQINWTTTEPVDVLTAGFPCQPVSVAGQRAGITDERWLFDEIITAIRQLDPSPRLCLFENVRGLLTANRGHAMARVIEGLASVGYVGRYGLLTAAAIGAPHRRERVFIVAYPQHGQQREPTIRRLRPQSGRGFTSNSNQLGSHWARTPRARVTRSENHSDATAADTHRDILRQYPAGTPAEKAWANPHHRFTNPDRTDRRFGQYAPAIHRWERILGRPAPAPTQPSRTGKPQLSARFVEWMMGLPEGHVTDVPDLSRAQQIRALGNGVVPQQAATALDRLTRD